MLRLTALVFWSFGFGISSGQAGTLPISPHKLREYAVHYELGRGVERDYHRARRLYCLAAVMGDRESLSYLGWMHFKGLGDNTSKTVAVGWFKRAAMRGDRSARNLLERYKDISPQMDSNCQQYKTSGKTPRAVIGDWVRLIAPEFGMDPDLVIAVIAAESNFNPDAMSRKKACGLMQLLPGTAKRFGVHDIWNPIENIIGGTAYLHWLMRHFRGDVELALAAYNAGEHAVFHYQGVPPYQETRNYVKRIMADYRKTWRPGAQSLQADARSEQHSAPEMEMQLDSGI